MLPHRRPFASPAADILRRDRGIVQAPSPGSLHQRHQAGASFADDVPMAACPSPLCGRCGGNDHIDLCRARLSCNRIHHLHLPSRRRLRVSHRSLKQRKPRFDDEQRQALHASNLRAPHSMTVQCTRSTLRGPEAASTLARNDLCSLRHMGFAYSRDVPRRNRNR